MPIAALPQDTVCAIGASQVLTDSASVVKELVDNALDAHASAIFIEISSNCLDVIQVRDNGYGVAPVDRSLVCMRYCTSKIASFEEIATIGGQCLGFRGEALASAAEMSGSMALSTRIEGEVTAVSLKIDRQGTIESEERISHPVGTTLRITDYLKAIPVRRQTALKTAAKTLSKIKRLLQAYALARPKVRISLKVLKAKTEKDNWMYAPKAEATTLDAATKVVGKKVTDQCVWKSWSTVDAQVQGPKPDSYTFECLLPGRECGISTINNVGQFISVDSRPVSCTRGTLKQISSAFKSSLKAISADRDGEKIVDPFICMNIVCPLGSYDANIEPAKDDVLFTDAQHVLQLAEIFFQDVYGAPKLVDGKPSSSKTPASKSNQTFDLLLARKPSSAEQTSIEPTGPKTFTPLQTDHAPTISALMEDRSLNIAQGTTCKVPSNSHIALSDTVLPHDEIPPNEQVQASTWKANMYAASDGEDDSDLSVPLNHRGSLRETSIDDEESELRDVQVSNPWTIAKVNAPIQRSAQAGGHARMLTPARQTGDVENALDQSPNERRLMPRALLSPDRTPRDESSTRHISSSPERFPYPLTARKRQGQTSTIGATPPSQSSNQGLYGRGILDTWVQKSVPPPNSSASLDTRREVDSSPSPSTAPTSEADNESLFIDAHTGNARPRDFVSARTLPMGTPLSEIPSVSQRPARGSGLKKQAKKGTGINKPFLSPVNDPHKVWFDVDPRSGRRGRSPQKRNQHSSPEYEQIHALTDDGTDPVSESQTQRVHPDLAMTLEYEARKADAVKNRKAYLRQQALGAKQTDLAPSSGPSYIASNGASPHLNRYNKATAALDSPSDDAATLGSATSPSQVSAFETGDPRGYLLRLQRRSQTPGGRRDGSISPSRARSGTSSRRRKTAMLPLENIDESCTTRDLELPLSSEVMDLTKINKTMEKIAEIDQYITSGKITCGFEEAKNINTVKSWEDRISTLIGKGYKRYVETGEQWEIKIELWPILQNHLASQDAANDIDPAVG